MSGERAVAAGFDGASILEWLGDRLVKRGGAAGFGAPGVLVWLSHPLLKRPGPAGVNGARALLLEACGCSAWRN